MYHNKLVVALKVDGKILREDNGVVTIPFGAEYSIFLKNLNSVRVQTKITVDGVDATESRWLVVSPNSFIDLERYIKNGNLYRGNKFKFIERTAKIEQHKGIGVEDGLIRVEFQTEQFVVQQYNISVPSVSYIPRSSSGIPPRSFVHSNIYRKYSSDSNCGMQSSSTISDFAINSTSVGTLGDEVLMAGGAVSDIGITVPGSESNQHFQEVESFPVVLPSEIIVLQLRGKIAGKKVSVPVTVDLKVNCPTCGRSNKSSMKFCGECGTAVSIV